MNKMKGFFKNLLLIILTFYSCEINHNKGESNSPNNNKAAIIRPTSDSTNLYVESIFNEPLNIDSFLIFNNLSLNSGVSQKNLIYFKPPEIGYYYGAYCFSDMDSSIIDADTTQNQVVNKSLKLLIYKVGKDTKEFNHQKSYPIYIFTEIEDKLLGKINFVGRNWNQLKGEFPKTQEANKNIITFQNKNKVLAFEIKKNIVAAVLFVHFQTKPNINEVCLFFKCK